MQLNIEDLPVPLSMQIPTVETSLMPICSRGWKVWPIAALSRFTCIERQIISARDANLAECSFAVEAGVDGLAILELKGQAGINAAAKLSAETGEVEWSATLRFRHYESFLFVFHSCASAPVLHQQPGLHVHWGTHVLIPPSPGALWMNPDAPVLPAPRFFQLPGVQ